ncbi:MAG: LLM class F420-dependent oxidoreductase [Anaerolineae bacterium]|nr:LLM class F420-dependent oxidoreductase [Anaerolineae bacterium]
MKIGAIFPQTEIGSDPIAIKDYAQAIEGMGFDYLLAFEHVLGANPDRPGGWNGPYTHQHMFHEPFVLFGYLAGLTERIELVTGILILPQRQTVLVAKQAAEVDVLSGGRLRLGIGVGWNKVEMQGLGFDFHSRGIRVDEQISLLRELWTKPLVTVCTDDHTIDDAGLNPLPVQQPIPIWIGGMADAVLKRAATHADGWFPNRPPQEKGPLLDKLRGYLAEAGRAGDDFGIDPRVNYADPTWPQQIDEWRELGATHICLDTMRAGLTSLQAHLEAQAEFKRVVNGE